MQNIRMLYTKSLLLVYVLISLGFTIMAQSARKITNKDEGVISFRGYDAWIDNHFYIDIYINNKSAKVIYAFRDSIRFADVRKDPRHIEMSLEKSKYGLEEQLPRQLVDSSIKIFEDHAAYTTDSIVINLNRDKNYASLLKSFSKVSKEELDPKIEHNWMDGYTVYVKIKAENTNLEVRTDTPNSATHPFLIQIISATLGRCDRCVAVKKISKYYVSLR